MGRRARRARRRRHPPQRRRRGITQGREGEDSLSFSLPSDAAIEQTERGGGWATFDTSWKVVTVVPASRSLSGDRVFIASAVPSLFPQISRGVGASNLQYLGRYT